MPFSRYSENFVWSTLNVLGKGATGVVYEGINRNNGESVAIKTFHQSSRMRPLEVQIREFEVMKKVNHENIVKLLAIEADQKNYGKVIIMELCTGKSLFHILDDPENMFGLKEDEFILVLKDVTSGMKYLRDNNLVHRDLKPGNIMKFFYDNGTPVYKLIDFGAARELEDNEKFMSLCGTEEYLHPDMYETAFLRKPIDKTFGANVDLWSIGVTLYHIAAGELPFRPFGGRRNRETMFYMTTKKASGVISGVQTSENSPIKWSRELPANCQISSDLKEFVTPLLAGLLETDPRKIWTFDRLFAAVTNIISRIPIHIFYMNKITSFKIFIQPDKMFEQIQTYIEEKFQIPATNQILLLKNSIFSNTSAREYLKTKSKKPLMLYSKEIISVNVEASIPNFFVFPSRISQDDVKTAKQICSVGYVCKRRIEKLFNYSNLIHRCIFQLTNFINDTLMKLYAKSQHNSEILQRIKKFVIFIEKTQEVLSKKCNRNNHLSNENLFNTIYDFDKMLSQKVNTIEQLYQQNVITNILKLEWDSRVKEIKCPVQLKILDRAAILVDRLRDSWQILKSDTVDHVLERLKITESKRRLILLLDNECIVILVQLTEKLNDWYKISQTVYLQTTILDKDFDTYEYKLKQIEDQLSVKSDIYIDQLTQDIDKFPQDNNVNVESKIEDNEAKDKEFQKFFENISTVNNNIKQILEDTSKCTDQISEFLQKATVNLSSIQNIEI